MVTMALILAASGLFAASGQNPPPAQSPDVLPDGPGKEATLKVCSGCHNVRIVASLVPSERLTTKCIIGEDDPVTLEWLMRDYIRHMRHHLKQILGDIAV